MKLLRIAEVFGHSVEDHTTAAKKDREERRCPFRNASCNKTSTTDPLGVCSFSDGERLAVVCPSRFLDTGRIFTDVGRLAFGAGARVVATPEIRVLRVERSIAERSARSQRIGKVDYLVAQLGADDHVVDFAALEVQAVYFSGASIRPAFRHYLKTGTVPIDANRRPDWRSSAQKRLMPQLALKVPIFRRWGKKFFVVVDSRFFAELPAMRTIDRFANSEVTWVVYPFAGSCSRYAIGAPQIVFTTWDDVSTALREGVAPDPSEIMGEIEQKRRREHLPVWET